MYVYKWWHRWVRKRTRPIPEDTAFKWKRRLSIAYGILAWNALGIVIYAAYQGKADWADYHGLKSEEEKAMPPAQGWANTLGIKNAKVYRIAGFQKVDEYEIVDGGVKKETAEKPNGTTEGLAE